MLWNAPWCPRPIRYDTRSSKHSSHYAPDVSLRAKPRFRSSSTAAKCWHHISVCGDWSLSICQKQFPARFAACSYGLRKQKDLRTRSGRKGSGERIFLSCNSKKSFSTEDTKATYRKSRSRAFVIARIIAEIKQKGHHSGRLSAKHLLPGSACFYFPNKPMCNQEH